MPQVGTDCLPYRVRVLGVCVFVFMSLLVYDNRPRLAHPVDTVACLCLQLWVPVHVQQEQVVPSDQIQTHSSCTTQ